MGDIFDEIAGSNKGDIFDQVAVPVGKYPESVKSSIKETGSSILKEGARLGTELTGMAAGAAKGARLGSIAGPYGAIAGSLAGAGLGLGTVKTGERLAEGDTLTGGKLAGDIASGAGYEMTGQGLTKAISTIGKTIGKVSKATLGATTGTGTASIEKYLEGGEAVTKAMRNETSGQEIASRVTNAFNQLKEVRADRYRSDLQLIKKDQSPLDLDEMKQGVINVIKKFVKHREPPAVKPQSPLPTIKTPEVVNHPSGGGFAVKKGDSFLADKNGHALFYQDEEIAGRVAAQLSKETQEQMAVQATKAVNVKPQDSFVPDWSRTSVGNIKYSPQAKELKKLYDQVMEWGVKPGDNTAIEVDRLKRILDNSYSDTSDIRAFITGARNVVKNTIVKEVPEYAKMTKSYEEASKLIEDMGITLMTRKHALNSNVTADMTLRRLITAMKNNQELRQDMLDILGKKAGEDFTGEMAGYLAQDFIPHGRFERQSSAAIAALSFFKPAFWPILLSSSPRLVGEFLRLYGKSLPAVKKVVPTVIRATAVGIGNKMQHPTGD